MSIIDRLLRREVLVVTTNYEIKPGTVYEATDGRRYRVTRQKVYPTAPQASWQTYGVEIHDR